MSTSSECDATADEARQHGGGSSELRRLGLRAHDVLDFSASCNPYGPCAAMIAAIHAAPLDRYPDPSGQEAREALGHCLDLAPNHIALGNGAAELLWTLARVLLRPGTRVLSVEPAFSEFRAAALQAGASVREWRAAPSQHFRVDLDAIERAIAAERASFLYLCTPTTPTGVGVAGAELRRLAERQPGVGILLDQSFLSLSERSADVALRFPENVICVRSLTKDHAIPGIRLGYLVATPEIVARVERGRAAWTTSAPAQAAASAASRLTHFVNESRARILDDRRHLSARLERLGLAPVASEAGFLCVRTGAATALQQRLLSRHRILVRDCSSFGLPDYVRLAARPERDVMCLLAALEQELQ